MHRFSCVLGDVNWSTFYLIIVRLLGKAKALPDLIAVITRLLEPGFLLAKNEVKTLN
jgi:hypothetical protein